MIKELVGWDDFERLRAAAADEGRLLGIGLGCYVEGTGPGPYEGAHVQVLNDGIGRGGHRPHLAGPGPPDGVRADRRRRARRAVRVGQGDHRRHPPVRLRRRHFRLPGCGDVRFRGGAGRPRGQGQGAAGRRRRAGVLTGRPGDHRRESSPSRAIRPPPSRWDTLRCCPTRCATPSTRRRKAATQFARPADPQRPPVRRGRGAGPGGQGLLLAAAQHVRLRHARRDRRDRPGDQRDRHPQVLRRARLRHPDQPDDRRRPGARRRRPGHRRRAVRGPSPTTSTGSCSTRRSWTS